MLGISEAQRQVEERLRKKRKKDEDTTNGFGNMFSIFESIFELFARCFEADGVFSKFVTNIEGFMQRHGDKAIDPQELSDSKHQRDILDLDQNIPEDLRLNFEHDVRRINDTKDKALRELLFEKLLGDTSQLLMQSDKAANRRLGNELAQKLVDKKKEDIRQDKEAYVRGMVGAEAFVEDDLENRVLNLIKAKLEDAHPNPVTNVEIWDAVKDDEFVKEALALPAEHLLRQKLERFKPAEDAMANEATLNTFVGRMSDESLKMRFINQVDQAYRQGADLNQLRYMLQGRDEPAVAADPVFAIAAANPGFAQTLQAALEDDTGEWNEASVLKTVNSTTEVGQAAYGSIAELEVLSNYKKDELSGIDASQLKHMHHLKDLVLMGDKISEENRRFALARRAYLDAQKYHLQLLEKPEENAELIEEAAELKKEAKLALDSARVQMQKAKLGFTPKLVLEIDARAKKETDSLVTDFNDQRKKQFVNMSKDSIRLMNKLIEKYNMNKQELASLEEIEEEQRTAPQKERIQKLKVEQQQLKRTVNRVAGKFGALYAKLPPESSDNRAGLLRAVALIVGNATAEDMQTTSGLDIKRALTGNGELPFSVELGDAEEVFASSIREMDIDFMGKTKFQSLSQAQGVYRDMQSIWDEYDQAPVQPESEKKKPTMASSFGGMM